MPAELSPRPGSYRYSLGEIGQRWQTLAEADDRIRDKKEEQRDLFDQKLIELTDHLQVHIQLAGMETPLLVNPPYPDYVSGYNSVIAASSRALEHVVGPRLRLTLTSTAVPGAVRRYDSGAALRADVVDARVWLGIHFRTADTAARTLPLSMKTEWT